MSIGSLFARPSLLWLLLVVPVLSLAVAWAARRRKTLLVRFGRPDLVGGLSNLDPRRRRITRFLLLAGLTAAAVGSAGPRWGKGSESGVVVGRDLILVLDLSRSMTAADMADPVRRQRWQAALDGYTGLVDRMRRSGGHRVGIVAFAARAWIVCPLTSDYDHVQARLDEFSPLAPPPEVRPEPGEDIATGTALGAGIALALETHDPRFPGHQDILVVSDGHGPGIENESEAAVSEAARRLVPVHTVGVGDRANSTPIPIDEDNIEFTLLQEGILKDIARRTKGEYVPAGRESPDLGDWFDRVLEDRPSRELSDDALPRPRDRSAWFLAAALVLLLVGWMWET